MSTEETINLIARVLAWQDGTPPALIDTVANDTDYQDAAQQCAEDLGIA